MSSRISQTLISIGLRSTGETVGTLLQRLRKAGPTHDGRVVVGHEEDTVSDALSLFKQFDVHHLPIVSNNKVIGIVSSTDLLELFKTSPLEDPAEITLGSIMTKQPRVVSREAPAREVITILAHAHYHSLPVVDPSGEIWDIITTRDLVRYLELVYEGEASVKSA
jgi:CBS domain-containing protein